MTLTTHPAEPSVGNSETNVHVCCRINISLLCSGLPAHSLSPSLEKTFVLLFLTICNWIMSRQNGNKRADKQNNKPNGEAPKGPGTVGQRRRSQGRASEPGADGKDSKGKRKVFYKFDEVEDEFEEFESVREIDMRPETNDNELTIWMNSWIDDDDIDFAAVMSNNNVNVVQSHP